MLKQKLQDFEDYLIDQGQLHCLSVAENFPILLNNYRDVELKSINGK